MSSIDSCVRLLRQRGDSEYGGESVTQIQHALQCAMLAEQDDASSELISAALLHDVGHLLHTLPDEAPDSGIDDAHEDLGHRYLRQVFGDAVTEPVRLHVPAKRYMCAKFVGYQDQLSHPSIVSLQLQGGPMTVRETEEFEQNSFADDAVRLRRWDDAAKISNLRTPPLEHYIRHLQASIP